MAAFCIFDLRRITDPAKLEAYKARVFETVERYGGRYRVTGGPHDVVEGSWKPVFLVLIEFPDLAAAHRWYDSPEYRDVKALRLSGTEGDAVFVEGLP